MTKISTLAFGALFFILACPNMALAQSAPPASKRQPSAGEMAIQNETQLKTVELNQAKRQLDRIFKRQLSVEEKLKTLELVEGKAGISSESFPEIVKNLQAKRIDLLVDVAGLEAKRDTILEAKKSKSDNAAVVAPLEKIIAIKQTKLEQARKSVSSGSGTADEVRSAEMSLLSSKVQLASIKSGNDGSSLLSDTLLDTSLALSESKARLAKTESLLSEVLPVRKELEFCTLFREQTIQVLKDKIAATNRITALTKELEELKKELQQFKNDEH